MRSFSLYIPSSYDPAVLWPLVLLFHAFGGEGERMLRSYGWDDTAETKGFLVVAPDGEWFETQGRSWAARSLLDPPVDDVAFAERLLGSLSSDYMLDSNRIYVVGNSQGGSMAYRLACELPERVAAVAAVATAPGGGRSNPEQAGCKHASLSLLHINGTADPHVPAPGLERGVERWGRWLKCAEVERTVDGPVTRATSLSCPRSVHVTLYLIEGGGHYYPGQAPRGDPMNVFHATPLIWEFFEGHPKPDS